MIIHFCPECGQKAEDGFKFCPNCGLKFPRDDTTEPQTLPDTSSPLQTDGNQKATPQASVKTTRSSSTRNSLKRKASCTPEKAEIKKLEVSPTKLESKSLRTPAKTSQVSVSVQNEPSCIPSNKSPEKPSCSPKTSLTSPTRKKGRLVKLEPLSENEVLTDNSNKKWVLAKILANEKTVHFYEAHTTPKTGKKELCILKLDSKDGKIYNEQNFFQRAAKKITVDKWKKSHACAALGIPTCVGFGVHENYRFLVFSALGKNLQTIIIENKLGDPLPEKAVYQIVYRMIDALEYIHENEYVHGDVTADNIFVNHDDSEVYLAGYHNAYRYCPAGKHVAFREGSRTPHEGTAEFISLDLHKGTGPTRRSDLESLGYCMLKWLSGSLPWSEETCCCTIMEHKNRFKPDVPGLLKQCFNRKKIPDILKTYLEYVMTLEYEEKPDYEEIRKNILSAMKKMAVMPYDPVQL